MNEEPTLSTQAVADMLGLSTRTILNLVSNKRIVGHVVMKGMRPVLRYRLSDIQAFKEEQSQMVDKILSEIEQITARFDPCGENDTPADMR